MRIGLLSDIHGNLTALRAVAAALAKEEPLDHVVVAGDHLLGGPRPVEVWELLAELGWTLVRGNEDDVLLSETIEHLDTLHRYAAAYAAQQRWTRALLSECMLNALAALPERWRLTTPAGDLLVVHSSPRSMVDRAGGVHNTAEEVLAAYGGTGAAIIAFGHYHRGFVRPTPFALLVNVASVSIPEDRQPLAGYTILHATAEGCVVEQRRVPYDARLERAAAKVRGLPAWRPTRQGASAPC